MNLNILYIFYKKFSNLIIKTYRYILFFIISSLLFLSYNKNLFHKIIRSISSDDINTLKTKICLCTVGKKENKYIKEYVEHYKAFGVDKIFLYDNNDVNGEKFEDILSEYIKNNFIEIFNFRGKIAPQLKIYGECYNKHKNDYDWFIFFDTDEFIHLNNYLNIKDFLNEKKFKKCK